MTSRCFLVVMVMCAVAAPAYADDDDAPPPVRIRFIPRYDFHLSADRLSSGDARFIWDTNFGGEVDLLDYAIGRATFTGNFESVLGNQFRNFDPNQGNYLLEGSLSLREHGTEAAALFHHTSRHLSDRFKSAAVAWNMLGVRVQRTMAGRGTAIHVKGDLLRSLVKNNVDYNWEANGDVHVAVPLRAALSFVSAARLQLVGVDATQNRGTQTGARAEAGVRFAGEKGAIELIVAAERRIDPYPLEFSTLSWVSAGFRFVSR
jgi:hypothetical protein